MTCPAARFNRADPARSLMLAKPTQQVAHGGGLRIELGSRYYNTVLHWISAGVPFGNAAADRVEKLEVLPNEVFMHGPNQTQQVIALAHYPDGCGARCHARSQHIEQHPRDRGRRCQAPA